MERADIQARRDFPGTAAYQDFQAIVQSLVTVVFLAIVAFLVTAESPVSVAIRVLKAMRVEPEQAAIADTQARVYPATVAFLDFLDTAGYPDIPESAGIQASPGYPVSPGIAAAVLADIRA